MPRRSPLTLTLIASLLALGACAKNEAAKPEPAEPPTPAVVCEQSIKLMNGELGEGIELSDLQVEDIRKGCVADASERLSADPEAYERWTGCAMKASNFSEYSTCAP